MAHILVVIFSISFSFMAFSSDKTDDAASSHTTLPSLSEFIYGSTILRIKDGRSCAPHPYLEKLAERLNFSKLNAELDFPYCQEILNAHLDTRELILPLIVATSHYQIALTLNDAGKITTWEKLILNFPLNTLLKIPFNIDFPGGIRGANFYLSADFDRFWMAGLFTAHALAKKGDKASCWQWTSKLLTYHLPIPGFAPPTERNMLNKLVAFANASSPLRPFFCGRHNKICCHELTYENLRKLGNSLILRKYSSCCSLAQKLAVAWHLDNLISDNFRGKDRPAVYQKFVLPLYSLSSQDPLAQYQVAVAFLSGALEGGLEKAKIFLRKSANQYFQPAQYLMGHKFRKSGNHKAAYGWYLLAAQAGYVPARFMLGIMCGTNLNPSHTNHFSEASRKGHPYALFALHIAEYNIACQGAYRSACGKEIYLRHEKRTIINLLETLKALSERGSDLAKVVLAAYNQNPSIITAYKKMVPLSILSSFQSKYEDFYETSFIENYLLCPRSLDATNYQSLPEL